MLRSDYMKSDYIYLGHALDHLRTLPDQSIDCVVTSPPYWGLRNYKSAPQIWGGTIDCDHVWTAGVKKGISGGIASPKVQTKDQANFQQTEDSPYELCEICGAWQGELGQEPDPNLYIEHLCLIFDEIHRILKDEGTMWINLGDCHSGSGSPGGDWNHGSRAEEPKFNYVQAHADVRPKSLVGIPARFQLAMTRRGWILRNEVIWHKPSCMPSSAADRLTIDFEKVFFFSKNESYYYKQQIQKCAPSNRYSGHEKKTDFRNKRTVLTDSVNETLAMYLLDLLEADRDGVLLGSIWPINPEPSTEKHFAMYPTRLIAPMIDASCPCFLCAQCGKPKKWMIHREKKECPPIGGAVKQSGGDNPTYSGNPVYMQATNKGTWVAQCECQASFEPGIVLDPFMGSGTTALVALRQHKHFIGCDVNPDYRAIAHKRIAPLLHTPKITTFLSPGCKIEKPNGL